MLRSAVDRQVLAPARELVAEGLARAVARGELDEDPSGVRSDLLFDVLAGALMHRQLVRGADVDAAFVDSLCCAILAALTSVSSPGADQRK